MAGRRKKRGLTAALVPVLIILICAALALALLRPKGDPAQAALTALEASRPTADAAAVGIDAEIADACARCLRYTVDTPFEQRLRSASGTVTRTTLDTERLTAGLADEMQSMLSNRAAAAKRSAELYAEDGSILPELLETLYTAAMEARLQHAEDYCRTEKIPVTLRLADGEWVLEDSDALHTDVPVRPGWAESAAALTPVPLHYTLPLTGPGPVPDMSNYGETADPQEIVRLLETPTAQKLIGGQKLDFDPKRDMLGRPIYYYLDETILALVWQQDEHGGLATFGEVFIADASQLRRKLADDEFGSYQTSYATQMAAQSNAVIAGSGDYYNNGRGEIGLFVYEGQLVRYGLSSGQSCLFDGSGDMLFTYEDTFADAEAAQRFIDEHNVWFSLNWGPVLIDNGVDVTPEDYLFGEVREGYARCAIGQLGTRHYLMMTINSETPDHGAYVTLRQAADSMIAHNCRNAYTLDGGQTASILMGDRLINPVQFGYERDVTDIYYFATAIPN